jgi:hypothetical protein|tara:strand:- start:169 stop:489 length:321 start_codon:yes stop_codon:yes gene_type:complete
MSISLLTQLDPTGIALLCYVKDLHIKYSGMPIGQVEDIYRENEPREGSILDEICFVIDGGRNLRYMIAEIVLNERRPYSSDNITGKQEPLVTIPYGRSRLVGSGIL